MIEEYLPGLGRVGGWSWDVGAAKLSIKGDSNVYLLQSADKAVLVDCATREGMEIIERNVREAGVAPEQLTDLVLTHSHMDHTAAAELWQRRYDLRIHLNAIAADWLARDDWRLIGHNGPGRGFAPGHVDHAMEDGQRFDAGGIRFTPIFAPGHTPDSTVLVAEVAGRRVGFCGDVCFGPDSEGNLGKIGWLCVLWESNLAHYRASLERMGQLELDMLLPGHGLIVDGAENVRQTISAAQQTVEQLQADPLVQHFGIQIQ